MPLQMKSSLVPSVRRVRWNGFYLAQSLIVAHRITHVNSNPTITTRGVRRYAISYKTNATNADLSTIETKILDLINKPVVKPYPADVAKDAILSVFSKQKPEIDLELFKYYYNFVESNYPSLYYFNDFICKGSPGDSSGLKLLTSVELTNTLFLFKDLLKKNKLPSFGYEHPKIGQMETMVEEFLILLLKRRSAQASVPKVVGRIMNSKLTIDNYVYLFAAGMGKFLPEVSLLQKQFDFSKLEAFEPVSEGISWLSKEFTEYYKSQEQLHNPALYDTLIPVMRYSHLLTSLQSLNTNFVKPDSVKQFANDPKAPEIQETLQEISGEASKCDDIIFGSQRNFFNALFCTTGLGNFDKIVSYLLKHKNSDSLFTSSEQSKIRIFLDKLLPLLASGVITTEQLANIKYGCIVARFKDNVLKPFKVSDNMFDNYEFSLLVLLDLADYAYILKQVRLALDKPFEECSFSEIDDAITTFSAGKQLLIQRDAQNLKSAVEVYSAYCLRAFVYFDKILADERLMNAIENQEEKHMHINEMSPKILEVTLQTPGKYSTLPNRVLAGFADILSDIRNNDTGINFSEFSPKKVSRFLSSKIKAELEELNLPGEFLKRLEELDRVLKSLIAEGGFDTTELDKISSEASVLIGKTEPVYVQVPEELHLHDFVDELVILRNDFLHGDFKTFSSDEVIRSLRDSIEAESNASPAVDNDLAIRFGVLANKLCRLFMINGNNTEVLDAIIRSHIVFNAFESNIENKKVVSEDFKSALEVDTAGTKYYQIPANFPLHTFATELELVQQYLKCPFLECSAEQILDAVKALCLETSNTEAALAFQNLYSNLVKLFRHNNDHTSVLDAIVTNQSVFTKFDKSLQRRRKQASEERNHTVASYQKELAAKRVELYAKSNQVDISKGKDRVNRRAAALNHTKSDDCASQNNLNKHNSQSLLKNDLEHILRKANKERQIEEEERFREREAYIWSTSMLKSLGTLETKQFFTLPDKNKFPMFPGVDNDAEYLVLAPKGHTILSKTNPLGATHIPEDMLSILERLSEPEIVKYSPSLAKLQKRGWNLIGSGNNNLMLVLSRQPRSYEFSFVKTAKLLFSTAGFVFITLLGLNYFLDDPKEQQATEGRQENVVKEIHTEPTNSSDRFDVVASKKSTWSGLFWK